MLILIVGYVCYRTITGGSSAHGAVARLNVYVAPSERSYVDAVYISALQMGNLTALNCHLNRLQHP